MQKTTNRITRRIIFVFLIFGVVLTLMLGLSFVAAFKSVEICMLDDILNAELQHFRSEIENTQGQGYFQSRTTRIYVAPLDATFHLPEHLRRLAQGTHDLTINDRNFRVLIKDIDNARYAVKFDDTNVHERERDFINLVWLCSITILIIALVIGWSASYQIIHPIKQLANQITSFKNKPDALLDLSEFNDGEIGVLAREIQHYHEQLQQMLIREKEFARNVSHELRTPVTSISLAAQILAMKKNLSSEEHQKIQRIQRAVGEMSELIETFLVLAHSCNKSSKYNNVVCEVGSIVRKVIEQQRLWLGDKPVEVIVNEKEQLNVTAPSGIISVLIANLIRNAFLYTEKGTTTVLITSSKLIIIDTGIGMASPGQPEVLKYQAGSTNLGDTNRIGGFGLPIVQRICECYGWKLSFESRQGHGSCFTVLFNSC